MNSTVSEEDEIAFDIFDEEDGSVLMVAESLWRGFAIELQELHYLKGASFINQLKLVVNSGEFRSIEGETNIFSAIGEESSDYDNLIKAARGQTNHVILNILTDYAPRLLAKDIQSYFEANADAREVLIMKGNKILSVSRRFVEGNYYIKMFMKRFLR